MWSIDTGRYFIFTLALPDGLLETLMEELKSLHAKLCMESLGDPSHHSKRSKVRIV